MKGIIDRFEGDIVVVEIDGKTKDFPKKIFPEEAKTGDVVVIDGNSVKVLKDETEKLRREAENLMDELFED
ncbi:DUF3006 domain-containing protein [Bacillus smithii]|uniref:DUF3006 domain-containing protein n=1 Tax=Bacillus smithii TaxID=1479 RepID=UPI003D1E97A0